MCLSSKVKKLRDELLENCKYAIDRLDAAMERVAYYSSNNQEDDTPGTSGTNEAPVKTTTSTSGTKKSESDISYEISDPEIVNSFMELTHGVLIQEWQHFLSGIFAEGVVYYLSGYDLDTPKITIKLKELNPTMKIAEMHKNIASQAAESFDNSYHHLLNQSCTLFKLKEFKKSESGKEMEKHVIIRNLFQHNKGKIRSQDIQKNDDKPFEILNDKKQQQSYKEGQKILLSLAEIEKLSNTIEKYSLKFQKQAENTKPVQTT